jgi:hypothetical protein
VNFRVGLSAYESATSVVEATTPLELDGRQVVLLDTPAFDHTRKSEIEILRIIALELEAKYVPFPVYNGLYKHSLSFERYRQGIKLHGIIYLHRITDVRVTDALKHDFLVLRKLCGNKGIRNVAIVTSMWNEVKAKDGRRRVGDLELTSDFFAPAIEEGARLMHHTGGTTVHAIIRSMLRNHPEALAIQEELVDKNMNIDQTSAGKEIDRWIAARIERYERQEDEIWEYSEKARRDGDEVTRSELLKEVKKIRAETSKLDKERKGQVAEYKRHQQQLGGEVL